MEVKSSSSSKGALSILCVLAVVVALRSTERHAVAASVCLCGASCDWRVSRIPSKLSLRCCGTSPHVMYPCVLRACSGVGGAGQGLPRGRPRGESGQGAPAHAPRRLAERRLPQVSHFISFFRCCRWPRFSLLGCACPVPCLPRTRARCVPCLLLPPPLLAADACQYARTYSFLFAYSQLAAAGCAQRGARHHAGRLGHAACHARGEA